MSKTYVVQSALVQAHGPDGIDRHFYQHAEVSADVVTKEHLRYLVETGMLAEKSDAPADDEATGYDAMKLDDLKAEIAKRNDDGRDSADRLALTGNKPELAASLRADDEAKRS